MTRVCHEIGARKELARTSAEGVRQDFLNEIYALVCRHADEHNPGVKQVADILDSADWAYRAGGRT